jgi:hypothetical protein
VRHQTQAHDATRHPLEGELASRRPLGNGDGGTLKLEFDAELGRLDAPAQVTPGPGGAHSHLDVRELVVEAQPPFTPGLDDHLGHDGHDRPSGTSRIGRFGPLDDLVRYAVAGVARACGCRRA